MNIMQIRVDPRMPVGIQQQEIDRIRDAQSGAVLFTSLFLSKNDKDEATLKMNNTIKAILSTYAVPFITCYHPEDHTIQFVKEIC